MTLSLAGVTRSAQSKACWLNSLAYFSIEWSKIKFDGDETSEVEHPETTFDEIYGIKGDYQAIAVFLTAYEKKPNPT